MIEVHHKVKYFLVVIFISVL